MNRKAMIAAALLFAWLPAASAQTVVALGDSITSGNPGFRSPAEIPPDGQGNPESQYTYWLAKRMPGWTFLNKGIGGEATREILARFESDVLANKPDIVIVMGGVNDLYRGYDVEALKNNLRKIYEAAKENGIKVVACAILPYNDAGSEVLKKMSEVNEWIREYSGQNGMIFCDTYAAAENPERPGKLAGTPDGLHPDVDTYRKVGEAVAAVLTAEKTS